MIEGGNTSLTGRLFKLAKYVRERVNQGKQSGAIVEVFTPYVKNSVTSFAYGDQGGINMGSSVQYFPKSEWHPRQQFAFAQEEIYASAVFKECIPAVAAEAAIKEDRAEANLSQFVAILVSRAPDTQEDEDLVDFVTLFNADLHNAPNAFNRREQSLGA